MADAAAAEMEKMKVEDEKKEVVTALAGRLRRRAPHRHRVCGAIPSPGAVARAPYPPLARPAPSPPLRGPAPDRPAL